MFKLNGNKGNKELRELLDNIDLEDIWHRRNPNTRCYSYFKPNSKIASRIDLWAIQNSLDPSVIRMSIVQAVKTDHANIILELKCSVCERAWLLEGE